MSDEYKNTNDDFEYQYQDDEVLDVTPEDSIVEGNDSESIDNIDNSSGIIDDSMPISGKQGILNHPFVKKHKRMLAAAGLVAGVAVVYMVIAPSSKPSLNSIAPNAAITAQKSHDIQSPSDVFNKDDKSSKSGSSSAAPSIAKVTPASNVSSANPGTSTKSAITDFSHPASEQKVESPAQVRAALTTKPGITQDDLNKFSDQLASRLASENKAAISAASEKTSASISELTKQNSALQNTVSELQKQVNALGDSLKSTQDNVRKLQQKALSLGVGFDANGTSAGDHPAATAPTSANQAKPAAKPEMKKYTIEAIVPGRAWLHGSDGKTVTISVGSMLGQYGAVLSIDPYTGVISTSSGRNIVSN